VLPFSTQLLGVILNGLQAVKDLARSTSALRPDIVLVQARSFGTEVPQDDAYRGILLQTAIRSLLSHHLPAYQIPEQAFLVAQFLVGSGLDHRSFVHDKYMVRVGDGAQPVRDHNPGSTQSLKIAAHNRLRLVVERTGSFIHQ
jgi:hypothetical protein